MNSYDFMVQMVWNKAVIVQGYDQAIWRKDRYGNWIKRSDHGNRNSKYGWEIDHITPIALFGSDHISNLQPLHFKANLAKQDYIL